MGKLDDRVKMQVEYKMLVEKLTQKLASDILERSDDKILLRTATTLHNLLNEK